MSRRRGLRSTIPATVMTVVALGLTALLVVPASATQDVGRAREQVHILTIMASDHALQAPAEVPAGPTRIEVMNHGAEPHQAALVRLEPGRTGAQYLTALAESFAAAAEVGTFVGGPNGAEPGTTTGVTADLEPGRHLVLCLIPSLDGVPHVVKGMVTELDVTGPAPKPSKPGARRSCTCASSSSASRPASCERCPPAS